MHFPPKSRPTLQGSYRPCPPGIKSTNCFTKDRRRRSAFTELEHLEEVSLPVNTYQLVLLTYLPSELLLFRDPTLLPHRPGPKAQATWPCTSHRTSTPFLRCLILSWHFCGPHSSWTRLHPSSLACSGVQSLTPWREKWALDSVLCSVLSELFAPEHPERSGGTRNHRDASLRRVD